MATRSTRSAPIAVLDVSSSVCSCCTTVAALAFSRSTFADTTRCSASRPAMSRFSSCADFSDIVPAARATWNVAFSWVAIRRLSATSAASAASLSPAARAVWLMAMRRTSSALLRSLASLSRALAASPSAAARASSCFPRAPASAATAFVRFLFCSASWLTAALTPSADVAVWDTFDANVSMSFLEAALPCLRLPIACAQATPSLRRESSSLASAAARSLASLASTASSSLSLSSRLLPLLACAESPAASDWPDFFSAATSAEMPSNVVDALS